MVNIFGRGIQLSIWIRMETPYPGKRAFFQILRIRMDAPTEDYYSKISPGRNTLSLIIRTYKAAVTKLCRGRGIEYFCWQRNYYDHVIRNERDLHKTRKYVRENPLKWEIDEENPVNF